MKEGIEPSTKEYESFTLPIKIFHLIVKKDKVGFEPTVIFKNYKSFQDFHLKPLSHLSKET